MNAEGFALDNATSKALSEIFQTWVKNGYSIRDVGSIMRWAINDLELLAVLDQPRKATTPL